MFNGKDNTHDKDLSYSVGKAKYAINIEKLYRPTGFWWFKKDEVYYKISVKVEDTYDFDEYRDDKSMGSMLNNWGYDMQKGDKLKPFSWDVFYTEERK